jgi:hypothetical protein
MLHALINSAGFYCTGSIAGGVKHLETQHIYRVRKFVLTLFIFKLTA